MKSHRLARIAEVVRETAATAILFDLKDPRVKNVTVTRAEVSGDLQHAKVYVSVMGSEKDQKLTMHGLKSAAGYIQTKVADQLTTRFVPHITFVIDEGVKKSIEVARLLREAKEAGGKAAGPKPEEAAADAEPDEDGANDPPADGSAHRPG
jgi:ribosome-binding factor A